MSRASITTGGSDFPLSTHGPNEPAPDSTMPMHIAVLGDFSGANSRTEQQRVPIAQRKLLAINPDNFDQVFAKLAVQLRLAPGDTLLEFSELDDLHPDFIYQQVGLFDKLRTLKRQLKKPDSFALAAAEIQAWGHYRNDASPPADSPPEVEPTTSLLDAALRGMDIDSQLSRGPRGKVDQLIKDIVSPFVEARADPREKDLLNSLEQATSEALRAIMHHSDFQQLEASWRGLYWLLRRIEDDSKISIYLLDISKEELRSELDKPDADNAVFQSLIEARSNPGDTPLALIIGDYTLHNTEQDGQLASHMARLAARGGGSWLSAGHEQIAACPDLSQELDPDHWPTVELQDAAVLQQWQSLRQHSYAAHLALAAPRFLLRLPYGPKTAPTESFNYYELKHDGAHAYYLWGNGAYLLASLLATGFAREGWGAQPGRDHEIDGLALHVYQEDGEQLVKPCAEVLLSDRTTSALNAAGLLTLRSVRNSDAIRVPQFQSLALDQQNLHGLWR